MTGWRAWTCAVLLLAQLGALACVGPALAQLEAVERGEMERVVEQLRQAVRLAGQGRRAEAAALMATVLSSSERLLGPRHPQTADCLEFLASLRRGDGAAAEAAGLSRRALAIRESALGPAHRKTEESLAALAQALKDTGGSGSLEEAEALAARLVALRQAAPTPEPLRVAAALEALAGIQQARGDFARAEATARLALALREKTQGPEHPDTAAGCNALALLLQARGDCAGAVPLHARARGIWSRALGPGHPNVAASLHNQAECAQASGDRAQAEALHRQALEIRRKALGEEHPDTAASLDSLADLRRAAGDLAGAEPLYRRAADILARNPGDAGRLEAVNLAKLARLYLDMGDAGRAEGLYRDALARLEKSAGPEHPLTAMAASGLADYYLSRNELGRAAPLYRRALAIWERSLGPEHPYVATCLENLAQESLAAGALDQAEAGHARALAIREKALGPEHPDTAASLKNLADLAAHKGERARAETLYRRALAIRAGALGDAHPLTLDARLGLAALFADAGANASAAGEFARVMRDSSGLIEQVLGFTSEGQKLAFLATQQEALHSYLGLAGRRLARDPGALRAAFDVWLRRKGLVMESQRRGQAALAGQADPEAARLANALNAVRAELSALAFAGPEGACEGGCGSRFRELERRKEELEAALSARSRTFAQGLRRDRADTGQVAAALPGGAVLVELALVRPFEFSSAGAERRWLPPRFLAFVLPAGKAEGLRLVDLGEAAPIDALALSYRKALLASGAGAVSTLARELHARVFAPLAPHLGGARVVYLSPDGSLSLLPFETFQRPDGRFLVQDYTFVRLAAGRDVLGFGAEPAAGRGGPPLVLGDPDFDTAGQGGTSAAGALATLAASGQKTMRSADMNGMSFERLPATRQEAQAVQGLLPGARLRLGPEAREAVLLEAHGPRVLHLATHAFFLSEQDLGAFRGRGAAAPRVENPLLRSGLALSGANRALRAGANAAGAEGLLTAEKVMGLDLAGTELVVLSACSTGEGEVRAGEGVYGLQRAFQQAGARSLVMSMWPVPDEETSELMTAFYGNLAAGMDRAQALRQAVLRELELTRARRGATHPLYWGAFVFLGDPGRPGSRAPR